MKNECEHEFDEDCVCKLCGFDGAEAYTYSPERRQRVAEAWDARSEE